jgi:predicted nucleic acid-binding protein
MPTRSKAPDVLVDTSVAVALMVADHQHHKATSRQLGQRRLGLAGHAAFETYSVMTRLPPPARRTPATVAQMIAVNFPFSRYLSAGQAAEVITTIADQGIGGGSIYDALIAAVAAEYGIRLATRDRRALDTYRIFGIDLEVLPDR